MRLTNLRILNGETNGVAIDVEGIDNVSIYGPSTLTGVISIEVSPDGTNWFPRAGVPAVNVLVDVPVVNAEEMRLVSTLAEGADRDFIVHGASLNVQ